MIGWIKLHRKLRNHPHMNRPAYRAVWIELLLEAEHGMKVENGILTEKSESERKSVIWKGKRIHLKPGQLTCGLKQLSLWTGVPRTTCKRVLDCFKNETMIETQTSNQFSLITVLNWHLYQMSGTQNGTTMERRWNDDGTPVDPPKECNNERMKESTTTVVEAAPPGQYGNKEINQMLAALKGKIGIADFADSQRWSRIYAKHCCSLLDKIGKDEFVRRLDIILKDDFKRKNCNKIRYVYEQIKGFIETENNFDQYVI